MRDLLLTAVIVGLLPLCLLSPWIGVLVWSWIGYMNPHRLTWEFAYTLPFGQMVAIATLAGLLFTKSRRPLPRKLEVYLLVVLWGIFGLSTISALSPDTAWEQLVKVSKILLMSFVTLMLFQDSKKLHALIWVIALSVGFYGFKGGIWAVMTGGANQVLGPPDSFIGGNTEIGLALNMVLPLLLLLRREERRPWLRHGLLAIFVFSIIAVLVTYSRGAVLGLAVVLPLLFLRSRAKLVVIPVAIVAVLVGRAALPMQWFERMETITTYEEDLSARMRLNSWYVAYRLASDRPLLGGGFRTFTPEVYAVYLPDYEWKGFDAHSIYLQVMGEHGFTGLAVYLALIVSTMVGLRRTVRRSRREPSMLWIYHCAQMVEVSLAGYLVSGAFLSMSYFDLFFHLVAVAIILRTLVDQRTLEPTQAMAPTSAGRALAGR